VGFALTILQRRLASSPEAIYQSLRRRRERLQKRLREEQVLKRGAEVCLYLTAGLPSYDEEDLDDLDEAPAAEVEEVQDQVVDQASAAQTIAELQAEIGTLQHLEQLALQVRNSRADRKWDELSKLLQNNAEMFDSHGHRRKLVLFTEHRDTLNYLAERIRALVGRPEAVVTIHGGVGREDRRKAQDAFTQDRDVDILVATDAAGEGINLQRAHLMVNYDLPWNPNRLEQRFGRIHRIGQTEVCHLWNLVASETREGDVYQRLLEKLDEERAALGGQVFDVLGQLRFDDQPLRELLLRAIRYGEQPEVRARLYAVVDQALDRGRLRSLLEGRALAHDAMDVTRVRQIRADMERAEARRLQPHFIAEFFLEAFRQLGGSIHEREPKRYEIKHVPAVICTRDRAIGRGEPVLAKYERITFEKDLISVPGKPLAAFVCPGQPLLDATLDLMIERHRDLLRRGAVLVDDADPGDGVRVLVYLEHAIQDARQDRQGNRRVVSRRFQFVTLDAQGHAQAAGPAPYLDCRSLTEAEQAVLTQLELPAWVKSDVESRAAEYAIAHLVPEHLAEVRGRKEELIARTRSAVQERLTKEINYWDHRAIRLEEQERAGKGNTKLNSQKARERANELAARLQKRLAELEQERQLAPLPPHAVGGALIVPAGLLRRLQGQEPPTFATDTKASERQAMEAVLAVERELGFRPRDVSAERLGYDIESAVPGTGRLRFIEVKGRAVGAQTVTVTKNEILTGLNQPDGFILALVLLGGDQPPQVRYVRRPFQKEPDFGATSVNYDLDELLARSEEPS
jgi:hypothetical protein